jgi:tetratricopeptide (TPR) repeat protein
MGLFSKKNLNIQDAKTLFNKGNLRKASKICKDYLEQNENDFEALNLLGDIFYKLGDKEKSLDNYRKLISILESEKYIDKAIAVIRKVIRQFPDQYDLYRKLAKLFEKKGFIAEQLKILYELSEIYQKDNLIDKSIDILKEIIEVDRNNIENYKKIFEVLDSLEKKHEINKLLYPALETAYNKKRNDILDFIVEVGLKNGADFTESIKFTFNYFERNRNKLDVFNRYAKKFLLEKEFDKNLFKSYVKINDVKSEWDFILELKDKYQDITIYNLLISCALKDNNYESLRKIFNEIQSLPDYLFVNEYSKIIEKYTDKIEDIETLDILAIIAGKLQSNDLQIKVYNKIVEIYTKRNEKEKADRIRSYIAGIKNSGDYEIYSADFTTSIDNEPLEKTIDDDFSDLIDHTSLSESDISVELTEGEPEFTLDVETTSLDSNEQEILTTNESSEPKEELEHEFDINDDFEFELELENDLTDEDLDKETEDKVIFNEDDNDNFNLYDDSSEEFDINLDETDEDVFDEKHDLGMDQNFLSDDDFNIFEEDEKEELSETEKTEVNDGESQFDIDVQIAKIKELMEIGNISEASEKIDELLLKYPDNDEVKSLSLQIFLSEKDYDEDEKENIQKQISDIFYDFKLVANSIRKSVNAQVRPDDYETHYDLAMAYLEMELFDEALEELKKSAVGNKRYESLYLMAECYKRMKKFEDAINIHKLIIIDYNDQEILKNSLYEMATILENIGEKSSAMNYYSKIYSLDKNFRDVKLKLDTFSIINIKPETKKEKQKGKKKKKISFL